MIAEVINQSLEVKCLMLIKVGDSSVVPVELWVVLHNSLIVSSGFVSAFYRLMCVKSKGHLIKAKTLIICEYVFILIAFVPGKLEIQIQLFFLYLNSLLFK